MSNGQMTEKGAPARRAAVRIRVDKLRQSRQRSIIGFAELAGLMGSAIMLLAVVFTYLYFYSPSISRLSTAQSERTRMQQKLSELQKDVQIKGTAQDSVTQISESLEKFEDDHLVGRDQGRVTLYNTLIQLIRSNNLRNTSGPAYTYLEAKGTGTTQTVRTGNSKWQSLYPGIGVTVTVEGQYANLRHFVRDIESSNQFIIINAVELERAAESDAGASVPGAAAPAAAPRSTLVSLRVDLAAYFRRGVSSEATGQPASTAR
ncbi:MAG TPA: GspMb/PilO family protein [Pyrinomonadaceae bacterium]|nr:GspMb/PilO family protein [Pyrinomonadaceae bacterium]